jgi:hypothetical protein
VEEEQERKTYGEEVVEVCIGPARIESQQRLGSVGKGRNRSQDIPLLVDVGGLAKFCRLLKGEQTSSRDFPDQIDGTGGPSTKKTKVLEVVDGRATRE